jgi:hypothetical protein
MDPEQKRATRKQAEPKNFRALASTSLALEKFPLVTIKRRQIFINLSIISKKKWDRKRNLVTSIPAPPSKGTMRWNRAVRFSSDLSVSVDNIEKIQGILQMDFDSLLQKRAELLAQGMGLFSSATWTTHGPDNLDAMLEDRLYQMGGKQCGCRKKSREELGVSVGTFSGIILELAAIISRSFLSRTDTALLIASPFPAPLSAVNGSLPRIRKNASMTLSLSVASSSSLANLVFSKGEAPSDSIIQIQLQRLCTGFGVDVVTDPSADCKVRTEGCPAECHVSAPESHQQHNLCFFIVLSHSLVELASYHRHFEVVAAYF